MTSCTAVVETYTTMRDDLTRLADRTADRRRRAVLRQRADMAGELAEQCQSRFGGGAVPDGARAVEDASGTSTLAKAADPSNVVELDGVAAAAGQANTTLNGILKSAARSTELSKRLGVPLDGLELELPTTRTDPEPNDRPAVLTTVILLATTVAAIVVPFALLSARRHGSWGRGRGRR